MVTFKGNLPGIINTRLAKLLLAAACALSSAVAVLAPAWAAPPVRIAVVAGSGSGIEQEIVDRVTNSITALSDVEVSQVNPDWYVICNIHENLDQVSGAIRYNGSIIFKTAGGQVLNTVAVQKYNQDFSLSGGAPLNKKLVDNAARDVINSSANRIVGPIQQAVIVEMQTRDRIIQAEDLAEQDKYADAIDLLQPITPETTHFKDVRDLIDQFQMELDALNRVNGAQEKAAKGRYSEAIAILKDVNIKSKRYKLSRQRIAAYRAALAKLSPKHKAK